MTMKNKSYLFLLLVISFAFSSCKKVKKDVNDYFPKLKTVSATILPDGSVQMKGEVISEGGAPIEYSGFCMSTSPVPKMLDNQTLADNSFSAVYSGFNTATRYYFRSWAANKYGYSYGDIISLDSVYATPLTAPCSPVMNSIDIGTGPNETYLSVGAPVSSGFTWDFQASSNSHTLNFSFGELPSTKIYTTTTSSSPSAGEVYVNFYSTSLSSVLNYGSSVYVNKISSTAWEITICSAPWTYSSSTFYLTTKFACPQ